KTCKTGHIRAFHTGRRGHGLCDGEAELCPSAEAKMFAWTTFDADVYRRDCNRTGDLPHERKHSLAQRTFRGPRTGWTCGDLNSRRFDHQTHAAKMPRRNLLLPSQVGP